MTGKKNLVRRLFIQECFNIEKKITYELAFEETCFCFSD